jgi:16S rRNA (guanine527-N7)-methyltransferase
LFSRDEAINEQVFNPNAFANLAADLVGVNLSTVQLEAFSWYANELLVWNRRFNLTAITDPKEIAVKHFLDSLSPLMVLQLQETDKVIDVGTGAGFPGLPLKIACPAMSLTLIESNKKKSEFCQHVVDSLDLSSVQVLAERVEVVGVTPQHRQNYDWALARAVAQLPVLVEYIMPLLRIGGWAVALKGETAPREAQQAEKALEIMGGRLDRLIPVELPGVVETRYLVMLEKVSGTGDAYPRRPGVPSKRPLT